jgi:hypothetical protein
MADTGGHTMTTRTRSFPAPWSQRRVRSTPWSSSWPQVTIGQRGVVAGGVGGGGAADETTTNLTRIGHPDKIFEFETVNHGERGSAQKPSVGPQFKGYGRVGNRSGVTGTAPSPG